MARKSRKNINTHEQTAANTVRRFSAALYVRLSNEERFSGANKNSFKNQKAFLLDYVEKHPEISIYKIYEDNGNTGTNFDRPAFSEMMYDVSNEKVDCIIVKDLSRFGREHIEMGKYLDYLFPMIGLRFIAINDSYDTYDKIKDNDMIVPFKNIINAVYSKDISRKVISSLSLKQHKGEFLGNYPPYGYNLDENRCFVKDDYAAQIVNRIYDMFIAGTTMSRISKILTHEGIDTPTIYRFKNGLIKSIKNRDDNLWSNSTIKSILTNPAYLGHMVQGKTKSMFLTTGIKKNETVDRKAWIIVENTHEAIISEEKYNKAQVIFAEMPKQQKKATGIENIFKSKIYCGECGKHLFVQRKRKNIFYICNLHGRYPEKCDFKTVNYKTISDAVFKSTKAYILAMLDFEKTVVKVKNTYQIKQKKRNFESGLKRLNVDLNKFKQQRFDLFKDYIEELIDADEFNFARESYTDEIEMLEEKIVILEREYNRFKKAMEPQEWVENFKKYRSSRRLSKEMVDYFIDKIVVFKNNTIDIKFKFSKEQLIKAEAE